MANKNINPRLQKKAFAQNQIAVSELAEKISAGDRSALALGITILESSTEKDIQKGTELLDLLAPEYIKSSAWRMAISGSPGVGKSTFIEALIKNQPDGKFAILTIDPSSEKTKGSILGDKTRMESISTLDNVFVRPSPSRSVLGGVGSMTREVMLLCESAGYEYIIIETVGVGQSETTVSQMVDLFMLLVLPGSGDEIQGIKRGIVELADIIAITKTDGDRKTIAQQSVRAYKNALHILSGKHDKKSIPVLPISSYTSEGIDKIWEEINSYKDYFSQESRLEKLRQTQVMQWYDHQLKEVIYEKFLANKNVQKSLKTHKAQIENGAVDIWSLLNQFRAGQF